ncbi:hypothetical protein CC80DRAFT_548075 [Byssothecium circinans]|uniref:HAT C-terminal dimerisation domain-containing protein n=1 Tax=Byssothecium circinans TaxID=147558 RepID=A0A6A5U0Q0_9PLEO|nr:hypothetical protein CC80DRAFT_548075 [Byssothecium circinans]
MNPTLKSAWFQQHWGNHPVKSTWLRNNILPVVKDLWLQEEHKRLKLDTPLDASATTRPDELHEYLSTDILITTDEYYNPIQYWNDRFHTQPDLAQMALDALAIPPCSDELERIFSSAKLLITHHRSRLHMDIIEANECLRAWFGRPTKGSFDDEDIGKEEGEVTDDSHASNQAPEDEDDSKEDQEGGPTTPIHISILGNWTALELLELQFKFSSWTGFTSEIQSSPVQSKSNTGSGFTADNVIQYEVVLADGSIVTASSTANSDLFKALKGGGSNLGVVTKFVHKTFPLGNVWGGDTAYSIDTIDQHADKHRSLGISEITNLSRPDMVLAGPARRSQQQRSYERVLNNYSLKIHDDIISTFGNDCNVILVFKSNECSTHNLESLGTFRDNAK